MLQRTAADIVGVPNKTVKVQPVMLFIYFSHQTSIKLVMKSINLPFLSPKTSNRDSLMRRADQETIVKWEPTTMASPM